MSKTKNAYMSLTQAAKHYSVSKGVLSKSLSSGKLSYVSKTDTGYEIDPAEMDRFIKSYKRKGDVSKDGVSKTKEPPNHNPKESDSLTILLQKNESLYEERLKDWKERNQELKERNQELKEELARTNQRLLDQPKQWQEEREKKDLELNKILQEEREKKEQELNKILELQQTKQQEQRKAEQKRQLVFFLILLILSAGLFLGLN